MEMHRRSFLIGLATALAVAPAARVLKAAPLLKPTPDALERHAYALEVLPNPLFPVDQQSGAHIIVEAFGDVRYLQVENGRFPTSYIRTGDAAATRAHETLSVDGLKAGTVYDFTNPSADAQAGFYVTRASTATYWDGNVRKWVEVEPNKPRRVPGKGLLIEESRTNFVRFSDAPPSQVVHLSPGHYAVSFYGSGRVRVSGRDMLTAIRYDNAVARGHALWGRKLTDAEMARIAR